MNFRIIVKTKTNKFACHVFLAVSLLTHIHTQIPFFYTINSIYLLLVSLSQFYFITFLSRTESNEKQKQQQLSDQKKENLFYIQKYVVFFFCFLSKLSLNEIGE